MSGTESKNKKEKSQKQVEYTEERKTLISMENGLRTLNIASLNPDSMKEKETRQEIINHLARNKIHIAVIQETHRSEPQPHDGQLRNNYNISRKAQRNRNRHWRHSSHDT